MYFRLLMVLMTESGWREGMD